MAENEKIVKMRAGHVRELLNKSAPQVLYEDLNPEDDVMAFWQDVSVGDILYMRVIFVSESEIQVQLMKFVEKMCYPANIVVWLGKDDCPNAIIGDYVTGIFEYVDHISKAVYLHVHEDILDIMHLSNKKVSEEHLTCEHGLCICEDSKKKRISKLADYWFDRGVEFQLKSEWEDAFAAYEKSHTMNLNDISPLLEQASMTSDSCICEDVIEVIAEKPKSSKKKSKNCKKRHCKKKHDRKLKNDRYQKDDRKAKSHQNGYHSAKNYQKDDRKAKSHQKGYCNAKNYQKDDCKAKSHQKGYCSAKNYQKNDCKAKSHQNDYRSAKNYQKDDRKAKSRHFPSNSYQSSRSYYSSYNHPSYHPILYQQSFYPFSSALNLPYQNYSPYSHSTVPFWSYQSYLSCSQAKDLQHWSPDWSNSSYNQSTDPRHWSPDWGYPSCSQFTANPFSPQRSSVSSRLSFSPQQSPSSSRLSFSPQQSPSSSRLSFSPQQSPSSSRLSFSPQQSPSSSRLSFSPQQSPSSSRLSFSPQRSPSSSGSPQPYRCSSRDVSPL